LFVFSEKSANNSCPCKYHVLQYFPTLDKFMFLNPQSPSFSHIVISIFIIRTRTCVCITRNWKIRKWGTFSYATIRFWYDYWVFKHCSKLNSFQHRETMLLHYHHILRLTISAWKKKAHNIIFFTDCIFFL